MNYSTVSGMVSLYSMSTKTGQDHTLCNPDKHGLVHRPADWPDSSFHKNTVYGLCSLIAVSGFQPEQAQKEDPT